MRAGRWQLAEASISPILPAFTCVNEGTVFAYTVISAVKKQRKQRANAKKQKEHSFVINLFV